MAWVRSSTFQRRMPGWFLGDLLLSYLMLFSFNESGSKSRRSVWTRIEQTGHLYGIGEQIGIRIWYFQQRHGRISAELLEIPDKVWLVSITAGVCYLCLIDFFARLMLHLRQSLLETDDTGIFFRIDAYKWMKQPLKLLFAQAGNGR